MEEMFTDGNTLSALLSTWAHHRDFPATYTPFVGVPSVEPSCEVEGFVALLHQYYRSCQVSPCRMGLEILLSRGNCLVPLVCVGAFANPKENLQAEEVLEISE